MKKLQDKIIWFNQLDYVKKLKGKDKIINNYGIFPIELLIPADWNYKNDDEETENNLKNNIEKNGQIQNIIVRELDNGLYEVINGNHRLKVMIESNNKYILCCNLGKISINKAKRIAIETNETKFPVENEKLINIFNDIINEYDIDDISKTMPYTKKEIESFNSIIQQDFTIDNTIQEEKEDFKIICPHCGKKVINN